MTPEPPAPFPRDVREFLLELSVGVNRYAIYPPGHPSLVPVATDVAERLADALAHRKALAVHVLPHAFRWEGVTSDPRHPVLSDLAHRLHENEIEGLEFTAGVEESEILALLSAVAGETRSGRTLGERVREEGIDLAHIRVVPVEYDELALQEDAAQRQSRALEHWRALIREAGGDVGGDPATAVERVSTAIRDAAGDRAGLARVARHLVPLLDALGEVAEGQLAGVRKGLSDLVQSLDGETRTRLLAAGGDTRWRRDLLGAASRSLDLQSMLDLLDAAAESSGQTISTSMTRLLSKLASHGASRSAGQTPVVDGVVRDNVTALLRDWSLDDPNPDEYTRMLDRMSRGRPGLTGTTDPEGRLDVAERIVTMALELDTWTARADDALLQLLDAGRLDRVYAVLDALPDGPAAERLRTRLRSPSMVRRVVGARRLPDASLDRMAQEAGPGAVAALMDGLIVARSRDARRRLFDLIAGFGVAIVPEVERRLPGSHWYVTRNLLALLQVIPGGGHLDVTPYLSHTDARVRRVALAVALEDRGAAERALLQALSDPDERVVGQAVLGLPGRVTPQVLDAVDRGVISAPRSAGLRALAVQALRGVRAHGARDVFLGVVYAPLEHDPESVALARSELRAGWGGEPVVEAALARLDAAEASRNRRGGGR